MRYKASSLTKTALGAALLAVSAWITLPIGPIPFTLQTLVLFLLHALLGGKACTRAVAVYLLLGSFGLPVFAGFQSGPGVLLGATGGYLTGFLAAALLMWALETPFGQTAKALAAAMVLGLLLCYAFGTVWFALFYTGSDSAMSLGSIFALCVLPYLPVDAVKLALALGLSKRLRPQLRSVGL